MTLQTLLNLPYRFLVLNNIIETYTLPPSHLIHQTLHLTLFNRPPTTGRESAMTRPSRPTPLFPDIHINPPTLVRESGR